MVVKAASFRKEQAVSIPLYDGMGNVVARLNLTQQANPNAEIIVPRLGRDGISCVSEFMKSLANAVTLEAQMNYRYTKIIMILILLLLFVAVNRISIIVI